MPNDPPVEGGTGPEAGSTVVRAFERSAEKPALRLSPEAQQTLEWIAYKYGGISCADALSRVLGTTKLLFEEIDRGASILIEDAGNGRQRKLLLREDPQPS